MKVYLRSFNFIMCCSFVLAIVFYVVAYANEESVGNEEQELTKYLRNNVEKQEILGKYENISMDKEQKEDIEQMDKEQKEKNWGDGNEKSQIGQKASEVLKKQEAKEYYVHNEYNSSKGINEDEIQDEDDDDEEEDEDEDEDEDEEEEEEEYHEILADEMLHARVSPIFKPGIYGSCKKTLPNNTIRVIVAQSYYSLWYIGDSTPRGIVYRFELSWSRCTKIFHHDTCIGKMKLQFNHFKREYEKNWFWAFFSHPNKIHFFGAFDSRKQTRLVLSAKKSYAGVPPPPENVLALSGAGFVWLYFTEPQQVLDKKLFLGYRVSLKNKWTSLWVVTTVLEDAVYKCDFPVIRPIHPCSRWRKNRTLCILVGDALGSHYYSATPALIKVESFYMPTPEDLRVYSRPKVILLKGVSDHLPKGPMFGYGNSSTYIPYARLPPHSYFDYLWVILFALLLGLIIAGIALVYYMANRAGHRDAQRIWRDWAESPGNVAIGLGGDTVAWEGNPPWIYRTVD